MPAWLIPIVIRMLSDAITPDVVKGLEKEVFAIVEKALAGHPLAAQILALLGDALGIKLDQVP